MSRKKHYRLHICLLLRFTLTEAMEMVELYQEFEKATATRWNSMFYVHYNFRAQDYCDD